MPKQNKLHIDVWNKGLFNIKKQLLNYIPSIFNNTDYTAVIIEPRNHEDLEIICKNVMYYLNESDSNIKWGLKIYYGNKNKKFVKNFTKEWDVQLENLEVDDLSGILYNNMLKTTKFWNTIPTENVLIFQTDTILRRFGIDEFISYNYVGAPWIRYREGKNVGNGGLSFRKKSRMLDITKEFQDDEITMEDIYFCKYLKDEDIAPYDIAKKFSVEDVYYENPLGLHQPKIDPSLLSYLLVINLHKDNFIKIKYRYSNSYNSVSLQEYVNKGQLLELKKYFLPYENMNILIDDLIEPFSFLEKSQINDVNNFLIEKNIKIHYLCTGWPTFDDLEFSNTNIKILRSPFAMAYYWKQWLEEKFDSNIEDINFDYKFNKLFYTLTRNPKQHRCLLLDKLCENNLLAKENIIS